MKFTVRKNKDSAGAFIDALTRAGHLYVKFRRGQDFHLYDADIKDIAERIPKFIYPHTPHTCWLWDGIYPQFPVRYNFVAAEGQKKAMELYGYRHPIEVIGFPRCRVLPFQRTDGKRLLFVPARPRKDGGTQWNWDIKAFKWVVEHVNLFDSVTICHVGQFDGYHHNARIRFFRQDLKLDTSPTENMLRFVDEADLVLSTTTVAYLGVARGKPTVFYGETTTPETTTGRRPEHWQDYEHLLRYPLTLEEMSTDEVLNVCGSENEAVEAWKRENIGEDFDEAKFVRLVEQSCADQ